MNAKAGEYRCSELRSLDVTISARYHWSVARQLTPFHYIISISGILPYNRNVTLQTLELFSAYAQLYNAATSPASRLRSAVTFKQAHLASFDSQLLFSVLFTGFILCYVIDVKYYAPINVMPEGGGGPRDRVGTLIRNKNLESNFLTLGIRFQFKVPTVGKVLSSTLAMRPRISSHLIMK